MKLSSNHNTAIIPNISEKYLSGYHLFCLEKPYFLDYASQNLSNILGYTSSEIHTVFNDKYSEMVCEEDRGKFLQYIDELAAKEQTLTLQYHIKCKDGHIAFLNDTMTSCRLEDGKMYGFAVVAEITNKRNTFFSRYNDAIKLIGPHGFLQCTCEKYPKVTHINQQMMEYLGVSDENSDWQDFLRDNIFFMIPFAERDSFREQLDKARNSDYPIKIEHNLLRSDGSKITLIGWLSITESESDEKEYTFIYMQQDNNENEVKDMRENSYFNALKSAYNIIFELNLETQTLECLHGRDTSEIGSLSELHTTIKSARNFYINNYVLEEDRDTFSDFIRDITSSKRWWNDTNVLQAEFRVDWIDKIVHRYLGVAVKLDSSIVLLCCRDISNLAYPRIQSKEITALNKLDSWLECFVKEDKHALGMLLVEEFKNIPSLIYASKRILLYLGIEEQDYLRYVSNEFPLKKCLQAFTLSLEEYETLIKEKEISIDVKSANSDESKRIKLVCTSHKQDKNNLYEILVFDESTETSQSIIPSDGLFARTFGHFDLFMDGFPIAFSSKKEKELLALLIDRNGGTLTPNEAISYLWEEEDANEKVSARYRKLAMGLKNTLAKHGIEHILINNRGVRSINVSALTCDYYEMLAGNEKYQSTFHNAYMTDYSWGEDTLATLWDYS
jgi:PAS domain S-box-containing protein